MGDISTFFFMCKFLGGNNITTAKASTYHFLCWNFSQLLMEDLKKVTFSFT